MITTLRIDEDLKRNCEAVFADLGLNMTSAVTLFLRQVVKQRGIPFPVTCERRSLAMDSGLRGRGEMARRLFDEMRMCGNAEMTPAEINSEIAAARTDRRRRSGVA